MSQYLKKIKRFPIWEKAFIYLIENNKSPNLPYHNNRHCINVFNTAIDIADSIGNIEENNIISLGIACLFHDFDHSGGKLKDRENIEIAIDGFYKFLGSNIVEFNGYILTDVIDMILSTEFPKKREPINIQQQIIMDSDLIQCYDKDWFIFAIKGLSDERGVSVSQALSDQTNFINNITYYTEFAQQLHDERKEDYLKTLENLKTLF